MSGFAQGTGLNSSVPAFRAIWRAWMGTMWAAESAVVRAGGFTWSNLDCELDDGDGGPSGGVSHRELPYAANGTAPLLSACGLSKANANPRADDKAAAPVLYRGINRSLAQQHCAPWLRAACNGSVLPHVPLQMPFSHGPFSNASQERDTAAFPFLAQDVARFRKPPSFTDRPSSETVCLQCWCAAISRGWRSAGSAA